MMDQDVASACDNVDRRDNYNTGCKRYAARYFCAATRVDGAPAGETSCNAMRTTATGGRAIRLR